LTPTEWGEYFPDEVGQPLADQIGNQSVNSDAGKNERERSANMPQKGKTLCAQKRTAPMAQDPRQG
jgi:hypothetical protein